MGAILRLAKDFRRAGSSRILPRWRTRRGRSREGARPLRGSFFEPSVFPVPPLQELGLRLRRARGIGRAAERVQEARFLFVSGDFLESLEELFWIRVGEVSDRVDSQVPEIGGNSGADPGQRGQLVVHGQGPPTAYPRFQITLPEISRGKHEKRRELALPPHGAKGLYFSTLAFAPTDAPACPEAWPSPVAARAPSALALPPAFACGWAGASLAAGSTGFAFRRASRWARRGFVAGFRAGSSATLSVAPAPASPATSPPAATAVPRLAAVP